MIIIIRTKSFNLDKNIREYINKKFIGLEKLIESCRADCEWGKMKPSCELFIDVEKETKHHKKGCIFKAEAKFHLPRIKITAETEAEGVAEAVDKLKEEFFNEIKKYKSKAVDKNRKEQRKFKISER